MLMGVDHRAGEVELARLSVVMIVRDDAAMLRGCLESVTWADEIVIVDAGSGDDTVAVARQFTDRVYVEADWQGFGVQRQRAQSFATGDWIFAIDADERVTPELRRSIENVIAADDRSVVGSVSRLPYFHGRAIRHGGWYPDRVVRLYPRERTGYGDAVLHESVVVPPDMRVLRLEGDLLHYSFRDLQHYLVKSTKYAMIWAGARERRGRRASLGRAMGHGVATFVKIYVLRAGFLDGRMGLLVALLAAHSTFVKWAELWLRRSGCTEEYAAAVDPGGRA